MDRTGEIRFFDLSIVDSNRRIKQRSVDRVPRCEARTGEEPQNQQCGHHGATKKQYDRSSNRRHDTTYLEDFDNLDFADKRLLTEVEYCNANRDVSIEGTKHKTAGRLFERRIER